MNVLPSPTKVLIYTENHKAIVDRFKLSQFLESKALETVSQNTWLDYYPESDYLDMFDFILKNLYRTSCIQIYEDGVIRLHLYLNCIECYRKSIFIQDSAILDDTTSKEAINALLSFSTQNQM